MPHRHRLSGIVACCALACALLLLLASRARGVTAQLDRASVFPDVTRDSPYRSAAEWGYVTGIIKGYPDGTYGPGREITRAEFASIVMRLLYGDLDDRVPASDAPPFPDTPAREWYAKAVALAADEGIVRGYPDGQFRPGLGILVAEALTVADRAYRLPVSVRVPAGAQYFEQPARNVRDAGAYLESFDRMDRRITRGEFILLLHLLDAWKARQPAPAQESSARHAAAPASSSAPAASLPDLGAQQQALLEQLLQQLRGTSSAGQAPAVPAPSSRQSSSAPAFVPASNSGPSSVATASSAPPSPSGQAMNTVPRQPGVCRGAHVSHGPGLSADGRYLVYHADFDNLDSDVNGLGGAFLYDRQNGSLERIATTAFSVAMTPDARLFAYQEALQDAGSFTTWSHVTATSGRLRDFFNWPVIVWDRDAGSRQEIPMDDLTRDRNALLPYRGDGTELAVSLDKRYVIYPFVINGSARMAVVYDRQLGRNFPGHPTFQNRFSEYIPTTGGTIARDPATGDFHVVRQTLGDFDAGLQEEGFRCWLSTNSADGKFTACETYEALLPEDRNNRMDVYVRDNATRAVTLVSRGKNGGPGVCSWDNGEASITQGSDLDGGTAYRPHCGDGIVQQGERCDPGPGGSETCERCLEY